MNKINLIVLLSGLTVLAGCASTPSLPNLPSPISSGDASATRGTPTADDSDGDSILDSADLCADSDPRAMVDRSGCEIALGAVDGVSFGPSEVSLSDSSKSSLDNYIDALIRYPEVIVNVEAHTDNRGTAASNLELSKERVLSVVRYMVSEGVSPDRIKPFGYGESRPRAANATAEGREQNRRVEIRVIDSLL